MACVPLEWSRGAISKYELHAALTQIGMTEAQEGLHKPFERFVEVDQCFKSADISTFGSEML